ncbi:hypothetical protein F66182_4856 [Fusarium sp. NRRL 66182]|nr:hypothetical protein F66182_4856 [Fusarium sp. NRRL 66182]
MKPVNDEKTTPSDSFGAIHMIEPKEPHTHTAVLLHGRGSYGDEFAQELFEETKLSDQLSLAEKLPSWRWVFPSSRGLWSTAFQEEMPAWFEAHSLTDTTTRQDLQIPGIKESVEYVNDILHTEIEKLHGSAEKVVLGGISQGAAVGMCTLLARGHSQKRLGAFFGASTWLPFAPNIGRFLSQSEGVSQETEGSESEGDAFLSDMLTKTRSALAQSKGRASLLSTPVFLGHGVDDAYVDVELGRQARDTLSQIGFLVEWKEYSGAELEGHWIKAPDEMDDVFHFLKTHVTT